MKRNYLGFRVEGLKISCISGENKNNQEQR
jgi:hypothetical protein